MKKLFVGNLPYGANETDVQGFFESAGVNVDSVTVMRDRFTGQARGFGFVEINDDAAATRAVELPWPKVRGLGLALASAMNSCKFCAGTCGLITISVSVPTSVATGAKSFTASYGVLSRLGLITCVLVTCSRV